jgi:hypothetical protein
MGHIRLGTLPRTRDWDEVVALIGEKAAVPQVARAAIRAAEQGLRQASSDKGAVESVRLLVCLPYAAKTPCFEDALDDLGIRVPPEPGLMQLVSAFSDALDTCLPNNRGRTDLGEMAQMAAAETLVAILHERTRSFFDVLPADIHRELSKLYTPKQFGILAKSFFARLTFKCLDYFLSRTLSLQVGEGRRFLTLAAVADFTQALETHCREAAVIVERFSGQWVSKTMYQCATYVILSVFCGSMGRGIRLQDNTR